MNRRHRIVRIGLAAAVLPSLRRPPESRAYPASRSPIYIDGACSPSRANGLPTSDLCDSTSYKRSEHILAPPNRPPESEDWGHPPRTSRVGSDRPTEPASVTTATTTDSMTIFEPSSASASATFRRKDDLQVQHSKGLCELTCQ
ncbi:hypothetical protein THAOC_03809 [Thalassiosira oceanica]|uniref:Uncharacterized protein n=1 Tax=Thalassiosira oceanica TaxID=159749 RepID=K0TBL0_THAOC|nr:hypothetical protein THAOC_03809 [Thalassiosira oceanica]|eukprot:EJK74509.1 hypothetical protein THAOC_03809 [Thalassiosira oceanica]